jgi:hypothetical protein
MCGSRRPASRSSSIWGLGLWAPGRSGDEGGCLEGGGDQRPGGLVEEAEGGGGAPSPAADEELKRLGKKREDAPHVSLAIWMGNHRLGYQATLIARFPSTYPQIF